tara:strand:+ start:1585 stop:3363 length:1779 start_codon:yes stop_codon:yes gene_type:complete
LKLKIPFQIIAFFISFTICVLLFGLDYKNSFLADYIYGNIKSVIRIFELVPGDTGDASLNNWFLERNLQYLLQGKNIFNIEEIFNAKIFWPEINTLAWSDNWILLSPLYGLLRLFSSEGKAFTLLISICLSANVVACYQLCRHATQRKLYRLIASILSGFSLTILARIGHAQLMPCFAGVLAIDSFIASLNSQKILKSNKLDSKKYSSSNKISINIACFLTGLNFLLLQLGIAFYQGVFFSLASGLLVLTLLFSKFILRNIKVKFDIDFLKNKIKKINFSLNFLFFIFLIWFNVQIYSQYLIFSRISGSRPWSEVARLIPKLWSYGFNTLSTPKSVSLPAPIQSINQDFYPGPFSEHSLFPGYTFIFLIIIGIWFGFKNLKKEDPHFWTWKINKIGQICLLMFLISIGFGGSQPLTTWILIFKFIPGLSSIRAVTRIGIPIVLLLSPVLAWSLNELHLRLDKKSMTFALAILFMFFLSGNLTSKIPRFDSKIYDSKVVEISKKVELTINKKNCESFYLSSSPDSSWWEYFVDNQLLAMWAAIKNDIPTSNGYSGHIPKNWSHKMSEFELKKWLKDKGINDYDASNVCWIKND